MLKGSEPVSSSAGRGLQLGETWASVRRLSWGIWLAAASNKRLVCCSHPEGLLFCSFLLGWFSSLNSGVGAGCSGLNSGRNVLRPCS